MTNEVIAGVMPAMPMGDTSTNALWEVVCDGGPMWPSLVLIAWGFLVLITPLLSISLCIRAWYYKKRHRRTPWTRRVILGSALLTAATTVVYVLQELRTAFFVMATMQLGAAQASMLSMAVSHDCTILLVGCVSTVCCLLCACCLPLGNSQQEDANASGAD